LNALRERLTCVTCGVGFERQATRGPAPVYCTPSCRNRAHHGRERADGRYAERLRAKKDKRQPVRHACTCVVCGSEFSARTASAKYCQPICSRRAFGARRKADGRLADQRRKRAPQRAAYQAAYRVTVPCAVCGTLTTQMRGRTERPTCGELCKAYLRCRWPQSKVPDSHPSRSTRIPDAHPARHRPCAHCGESLTIRHAGQTYCDEGCSSRAAAVRARARRPRFVACKCRECSTSFLLDRQAFGSHGVFCSTRCSLRYHSAVRRARERGVERETVRRVEVFERDKWRCHLCGKKIKRDVVVPHPLAATLDHVVPLEQLGPHTMANLRAAHFRCNSIKSNRGGGEQLALLG
jgi:hypothetical protein